MNGNTNSNGKTDENPFFKPDSNGSLNFKSEKQNEKIENNNPNNSGKNKLSSFNNIQISSNNNNDNAKKENMYSYVSANKKQIQNFQISSINNSNNKYSNNESHQGISFIAKNNKENTKKLQTSTKINIQWHYPVHQEIFHIHGLSILIKYIF